MMATHMQAFDEVQEELLALGGTAVQPSYQEDIIHQLARHGQLFAGPVRLRPGRRHQCHRNAAEIWAQDVAGYALCSGYALAGGTWRIHS
jgi:hypothetical protein